MPTVGTLYLLLGSPNTFKTDHHTIDAMCSAQLLPVDEASWSSIVVRQGDGQQREIGSIGGDFRV